MHSRLVVLPSVSTRNLESQNFRPTFEAGTIEGSARPFRYSRYPPLMSTRLSPNFRAYSINLLSNPSTLIYDLVLLDAFHLILVSPNAVIIIDVYSIPSGLISLFKSWWSVYIYYMHSLVL